VRTAPSAHRGVVGRRVLTCLQTIDIGRLTSDPVFLVPGGFIAVTGQGPIDSNESSKTTFEAALSLVHGDPGWRQESPQFSGYAAQLLFNPPNAPAGARVRADLGFIVAVFAHAGGDGSGRLVGGGDPVSVWIRLRRHDDPAFEVAVTPGVRLAHGNTHGGRVEDAKQVWSTLRGPKWGPQRYARELYGPGVSCLSYVATRGGRTEQRTTLLGSDISQLTPEQIAWQLTDLAAMHHLFDNEATQRVEFFRLSQQLKVKEQAVRQADAAVAGYEKEVGASEGRLRLLDQAAAARDRHVAETVRQTLKDLAALCSDRDAAAMEVEHAKRAIELVKKRLDALDPVVVAREVTAAAEKLTEARRLREPTSQQAERLRVHLKVAERDLRAVSAAAIGWSGRPAVLVEAECVGVQADADQANVAARVAAERQNMASEHLDAVRRGDAGLVGRRLDDADVPWQLLHDGVHIADQARTLFEPLLAPFEGAVCVPPGHGTRALTAVADLPGTMLVSGDGPLPTGVIAAPPGAAALLGWLAAEGRPVGGTASLAGSITIVGGFAEPTTGRAAREASALAALEEATTAAASAEQLAAQAGETLAALEQELEAARAEKRRAELVEERDQLRSQAAAVAVQLQPLDDAVERADSAHRDAKARQRNLKERQAEVASHLDDLQTQLDQHQKKLRELVDSAGRFLLPAWVAYLETCTPPASHTIADETITHDPLNLPPALADAVRARADDVLAERPGGIGHRDLLARLEADLGIDVTVIAGRRETTRATVKNRDGTLDPVTHEALVRYHEQVASVDRRRTRDSEEREVAGLDAAITALRTAVTRQAQGMRSALERAEAERNRLRREYESAYDEVHATDSNIRNIQRGLEHQVRGLFNRVSQRFNEIRYRDGGHGGELAFEIVPPTLDLPSDNNGTNRPWVLTATPRWARRPPDGTRVEHVSYREQANTAQYKLATVQLVLAALLANEDPIGRMLILDELGDGLGDVHRDRVLDALRRAAKETGITVLATIQDDMQHDAFARCSEVLVLRYPAEVELLNEPTYMFAGDMRGDGEATLVPLTDALSAGRGPGWSSLLAVYDAAAAANAAERRAHRDAS
jgi:hypothetical protein